MNTRGVIHFALLAAAVLAAPGSAHPLPAQPEGASGGNYFQQKFAAANAAYERADFAQARELYEELRQMELAEPAVYYNLGNTYAQLAQPGRAVWAYERALRLSPRDAKIHFNLRQLRGASAGEQPFVLLAPFVYLRDRLTLNEWALLLSGCWFLIGLLLLSSGFLPRGPARHALTRAALLMLLPLLACSAFLFAKCRAELWTRQAVMLDAAISRSGPGLNYKEHVSIPVGQKVQLRAKSRDGEWAEIFLPGQSQTSYVRADALGVL